jgi:hypothetical protein
MVRKLRKRRAKVLHLDPIECDAGHTLRISVHVDSKTGQARLKSATDADYECASCIEIYEMMMSSIQVQASQRGLKTIPAGDEAR